MNFKHWFLGILLFCPSLHLHAQTPTANTLLWQISGNGLQRPSYIFGSYHLIGKDFTDTLPVIMACYRKTDAVAGEVIIDNLQDAALVMMPYMQLKDNRLDQLLSPAEFEEVDHYLQEVSPLKLTQFNHFKPAAVAAILENLTAKSTITATNPSLDMYFQQEAKNDHKQVTGLETIEFQAALLFGAPDARQREQLLQTVRDQKKDRIENEKLFSAYTSQQLGALEKAFEESDDLTPAEKETLLTNRNRNWMTQLPALMSRKATFVVVGAGHLVGTQGLLNLFVQAGYTVTPVATK